MGPQLCRVADESRRGMRLLTDPMDAYVSLPAEVKEEIDRDVA